jgi:hypothetical protein
VSLLHPASDAFLHAANRDSAVVAVQRKKNKNNTRMKLIKQIKPLGQKIRSRLPSLLVAAAILALNTLPASAQAFSSTELKTGISNSLAVIMMFGFVLGIACVIYGGFAIRRGDVDQGKMSIIGGAIIAAAPAVIFAFFKIFVGIGNF